MSWASLWDFGDPAASESRFRAYAAEHPEETAEVRTQVARALGLQGRFEEGHQELDAIGEPTNARLRARIALERGRLLNSAGEPGQAMAFFTDAARRAAEADDGPLELDAIHMLAIAGSPEEQVHWAQVGLERADVSDDPAVRRWRGPLLNNLGWTLHDMGRFEEALEAFRRGVTVRQEAGVAGPLHIARWAEARALRSLGRLEEALAIQDALLAEGPEDGYVFEERAELLLALGREAEAREAFRQAYPLLRDQVEPERATRLAALGGLV